MPYKDKEKAKQASKEYYEKNKERCLINRKIYREEHREEIQEKKSKYCRTPVGLKNQRMRKWRDRGVKNVNDEMYDIYNKTTECDCCKKKFSSSFDKHLDHDHETGEFRQILCCSCNTHDSWKNKV